MDSNHINQLLSKYWEGQSSVDEERQLKAYFAQETIDPEHQQFQPLFSFFKEEAELSLSADFDKKLMQQLNTQTVKAPARVFSLKPLLRVAAILVLGLAIAFGFYQSNQPEVEKSAEIDWSKYEITNEEEALKELQLALRLVSKNIDKGTTASQKAGRNMDKVTTIISK